MSGKRELIYRGIDSGVSFENLTNSINYLLNEASILEILEECFRDFLQVVLSDLDQSEERGRISLNRFNARNQGQDAFYIHFSPSENEKKTVCHCIFCTIAEGRFFTKEIRFYENNCQPKYLQDQFCPYLKHLFERLGFCVIEPGEYFSKPKDI